MSHNVMVGSVSAHSFSSCQPEVKVTFTVYTSHPKQTGLENTDYVSKSLKQHPNPACQRPLEYSPLCTCSSNESASQHSTITTCTDDLVTTHSSASSKVSQSSQWSKSNAGSSDKESTSIVLKHLEYSVSASSQNVELTKSSTSFAHKSAELLKSSISAKSIKTESILLKSTELETSKSFTTPGRYLEVTKDTGKEEINFLEGPSREGGVVPSVDKCSSGDRSDSSYKSCVAVMADLEWIVDKENNK